MPWHVYSKEYNDFISYEQPLKPIILVNTKTKETTRILGVKTLMEMSGKSRDIVSRRIDHTKLKLGIGGDEYILKTPLEINLVIRGQKNSCCYNNKEYIGVENIEKLRSWFYGWDLSRENFNPKF